LREKHKVNWKWFHKSSLWGSAI